MRRDDYDKRRPIVGQVCRIWLVGLLLLLLLPLTTGCLTTLAITAATQGGGDSEHVERVKETARDMADHARDTADDVALSVQDTFESIGD